VLIKQSDKKFGLTGAKKERIRCCEDTDKIDAALDAILTAGSKAEVLWFLE